MSGFLRGFGGMMEGGPSNQTMPMAFQPRVNFNNPTPPQAQAQAQAQPAGFFNGNDQKLFGFTNNTNLKVKGDGNGSLSLLNNK